MTAWSRFIDNVKWNYPFPLVIFGMVVFIVTAVLITINIMNLLVHVRIRDRLPETQKEEIKHYERLIAEKEKRMSWLESEIDVQRQAVRGAMGYLSGLIARDDAPTPHIRREK